MLLKLTHRVWSLSQESPNLLNSGLALQTTNNITRPFIIRWPTKLIAALLGINFLALFTALTVALTRFACAITNHTFETTIKNI